MSEMVLSDLDGAYPLIRDAVVAETRTFHPDFAATTFGDSRLVADGFGALDLLKKLGMGFGIVPVGEDITTEQTAETDDTALSRDRRRRYYLRLIVAQQAGAKEDEDVFFTRLELIENRWGAMDTFTVDLVGFSVEFRVAIESAAPLAVDTNDAREVTGHAAERRIRLEVTVCAN